MVNRFVRRLSQPNAFLANAIRVAMENVVGGPTQLDVLGFDACLMQALGALEDFHDLTKYYLASQATEPGTGKQYHAFLDRGRYV